MYLVVSLFVKRGFLEKDLKLWLFNGCLCMYIVGVKSILVECVCVLLVRCCLILWRRFLFYVVVKEIL